MLDLTCVQNPTDHPRHHHQEHWQQLQVPTHDTTSLYMGHVLAGETSLDNNLSMTHGHETLQERALLRSLPAASRCNDAL